jgi:hypothetical protein
MEELERQMELIWRQERKRRGAGGVKSGASESILYLLCWRTIFIQQMYIQSFLYFYQAVGVKYSTRQGAKPACGSAFLLPQATKVLLRYF